MFAIAFGFLFLSAMLADTSTLGAFGCLAMFAVMLRVK